MTFNNSPVPSFRNLISRIPTLSRRLRVKRSADASASGQLFEDVEYEVDLADFPPYQLLGQNIHRSPWNLSLYHMISLQLYYPPEMYSSATTFKALVEIGYEKTLQECVPEYDGGTDVNVFLDKMELYAALEKRTYLREELLQNFLKGAALEWYNNTLGSLACHEHLSWMELRKCLQLAFPKQCLTDNVFTQLEHRSQGPLVRVQPYVVSVLNLCRQCDPMMEEDVIVCYIKIGLNAHYRKMIIPEARYRLQDLWDTLLRLENYYPVHNVENPGSIATTSTTPTS